ncbi:Putative papain-like cysteine peptidase superfamily [Septoria linicola]|uniref:Papain-like cysteine peptidase superfamily n=1 Tax=Septoria linicola TaxID=215465 RepID=A0A9Q9AJC7_9PEZI|nr:putative papain-like cysteine peptidase superfamily [Septoria linicola]USW46986.1 Putative papain-like cysteine peptidase superfamily [Septoria linicola]
MEKGEQQDAFEFLDLLTDPLKAKSTELDNDSSYLDVLFGSSMSYRRPSTYQSTLREEVQLDVAILASALQPDAIEVNCGRAQCKSQYHSLINVWQSYSANASKLLIMVNLFDKQTGAKNTTKALAPNGLFPVTGINKLCRVTVKVLHIGATSHSGHYIADIRDTEEALWTKTYYGSPASVYGVLMTTVDAARMTIYCRIVAHEKHKVADAYEAFRQTMVEDSKPAFEDTNLAVSTLTAELQTILEYVVGLFAKMPRMGPSAIIITDQAWVKLLGQLKNQTSNMYKDLRRRQTLNRDIEASALLLTAILVQNHWPVLDTGADVSTAAKATYDVIYDSHDIGKHVLALAEDHLEQYTILGRSALAGGVHVTSA